MSGSERGWGLGLRCPGLLTRPLRFIPSQNAGYGQRPLPMKKMETRSTVLPAYRLKSLKMTTTILAECEKVVSRCAAKNWIIWAFCFGYANRSNCWSIGTGVGTSALRT